MFYYVKVNKTILMFYGKFADEEDSMLDVPNIYYVEGDNRVSPSLEYMTIGSVLKILFFSFFFRKLFCYLLQNKIFNLYSRIFKDLLIKVQSYI